MGGQKCAADFYAHLSKKLTVTLAVAKENKAVADLPYTVLPFLYNHWRGFLNIIYLFKLKKIAREKKIDLLIIENSYFGWLGLLLRKITKIPVVIRSHNIEAYRFRDLQKSWWRLYDWYEKRVHRRVNHSFFITAEEREWAISHWRLDAAKCGVLTCGANILESPSHEEKKKCRDILVQTHGIAQGTRLFYFNGTLDYLPNTDALRIIISELIPLLTSINFRFRIFVSGNRLSGQWKEALQTYPNIIYTGFVNDIGLYYKGADCFINPVTLGNGIKIKLIDALSYNQSAISTKTGAKGITATASGSKLVIIEDYDWQSFAAAMVKYNYPGVENTPEDFYREFNWDNIIQKALLSLQTHE